MSVLLCLLMHPPPLTGPDPARALMLIHTSGISKIVFAPPESIRINPEASMQCVNILESLRKEWGLVQDIIAGFKCEMWLATVLMPYANESYTVKNKSASASSFIIRNSLKVFQ